MNDEEKLERAERFLLSLYAHAQPPQTASGSFRVWDFGVGHDEILKDAIEMLSKYKRLREAVWPGLPKFTPTAEVPQQDFFECMIESFRTTAENHDRLVAEVEAIARNIEATEVQA